MENKNTFPSHLVRTIVEVAEEYGRMSPEIKIARGNAVLGDLIENLWELLRLYPDQVPTKMYPPVAWILQALQRVSKCNELPVSKSVLMPDAYRAYRFSRNVTSGFLATEMFEKVMREFGPRFVDGFFYTDVLEHVLGKADRSLTIASITDSAGLVSRMENFLLVDDVYTRALRPLFEKARPILYKQH